MNIGTHLINLELLSFEQAEAVLEYQMEHPSLKFGEIAVLLDFLTQNKLDSFLDVINKP